MARIWVVIVFIIMGQFIEAQIPAEIFVGEKRATIDVMFLSILKYQRRELPMVVLSPQPGIGRCTYIVAPTVGTFGFTEAISYNAPSLKGLAPVAVLSVLNGGLTPRPVCSMFRSILNLPSLPGQLPPCNKTRCWIIFTDALYTLYISKNKSFLQLESVNAIATREATSHSFTLRTRMGLKHHHFQWGVGLDPVIHRQK